MEFLFLPLGVLLAVGAGTWVALYRRASRAESTVLTLLAQLEAERHAARHDALTGLANRRGFYERGAELVGDLAGTGLVAVMFDLDDFKRVNDCLGHAAGDQVLIAVAQRLASHGGDHLVARLGGDEFAGLFRTGVDRGGLRTAIAELAELLATPIWVGDRWLIPSVSIGVAPVLRGATLSEVLGRADSAMYRAKSTGVGTAWFDPLHDDHTVPRQGVRPAVRTRDLQPTVLAPIGAATGDGA